MPDYPAIKLQQSGINMSQGDAQLVARDCWKSAVYTPAAYLVNMAGMDESRLYHHMKAADLWIAPMMLGAPLGAVQVAHAAPSSKPCELCA